MEQQYELRMETWHVDLPSDGSSKAKVFDIQPTLVYSTAPNFDQLILEMIELPLGNLHPATAIASPPTYFMRDAVIYKAGSETPLVTLHALDNDGKIINNPLQHKGSVRYEIEGNYLDASSKVFQFLMDNVAYGSMSKIPLGNFDEKKKIVFPASHTLQKEAGLLGKECLQKADYFDFIKREFYDGLPALFPYGVNVDTRQRHVGILPAIREMLTSRISAHGAFKTPPPNIDYTHAAVFKPKQDDICIYMTLQEEWNDGPAKKPGLYFLCPNPKEMKRFLADHPSLGAIIKEPIKPTPVAVSDTTEYLDARITNEVKHFLKNTTATRETVRTTSQRLRSVKPLKEGKGHQL